MKKSLSFRGGFTLVELLSYLALFGMILSVIYSIYYQFSRTIFAAEITIVNERKLFDTIRAVQDDFRRSSEVLEQFGPFTASDHCLILKSNNEGGSEIVIYRLDTTRETLTRFHSENDQSSANVSSRIMSEGIKRFTCSVSRETGLLKISLEPKERFYGVPRKGPITVYASIRNG